MQFSIRTEVSARTLSRIWALGFLALTSPAFATVWNLADDYSLSANPSGRWSYGTSLVPGQDFTLFSKVFPQEREASGGVCAGWAGDIYNGYEHMPITQKCFGDPKRYAVHIGYPSEGPRPAVKQRNGGVFVHPADGDSGYVVVRWTAPKNAVYTIWASFYSADVYTGATASVQVLLNGSPLSEGTVSGFSGNKSYTTPDSGLRLSSGDVIDIVVGNGGNGYGGDSTGVDAVIRTLDSRL